MVLSSSPARAAPAVTTRPRPTERTARARVRFFEESRPVQPLASVRRIALSCSKMALLSKPLGGRPAGLKASRSQDYYWPDHGAFTAGIPQNESYNSAATPAT